MRATDARASGNTPIEYFDRMYEDPDPWGYESSWYEQRKYAITVASLPHQRYRRAFEPGCSIGVLTAMLALRCDELIAWDLHRVAAARARDRVRAAPHVTVTTGAVPEDFPDGSFDLVVLSEVAYYLDDRHHDLLIDQVAARLEPGGDAVLVHWLGDTDYPQTGRAVHDRWGADHRFEPVAGHEDEAFRLDVLRRRSDLDP